MSSVGLFPPPSESCLERSYPSSQKGGTLIAAGVADLATHTRALCDPDVYRPATCPRCDHSVLHAHDYRDRRLRGEDGPEVTRVRRFSCMKADCHAIWQILPEFIARHLHRSWSVVAVALRGQRRPGQPTVPQRTTERWKQRLDTSAAWMVQALAVSAERSGLALVAALCGAVGHDARREHVVAIFTDGLAALAALVHRLVPGARVM